MDQSNISVTGERIGVVTHAEIANQHAQNAGVSGTPVALDSKSLRNLVERRHPKYENLNPHWEFVRLTYEGGREWFDGNIFQYLKEGEQEYSDRKKRAYRFNHSREVVDLVNKHLFRQEILRNDAEAPEEIKAFWKKATKSGLGIDDMMQLVSKEGSLFGQIAIVIDSNKTPGAISVAEARRTGGSVYAYVVRPSNLLDYSEASDGSLNWALIQESFRDDEDPFKKNDGVSVRWRLWTKTEWILIQQRSTKGKRRELFVADRGNHDLGVTPVVLHRNVISDAEWSAPGMIDDIAYMDRAVANYLSNLDAIIQDQTFSQLVMPAQGMMPTDKDYESLLNVGTKRIFLYDAEGGGVPMYISPDVKQAKLIVDTIQKIINEIYHTVGLAGERTKEDNSVGIDNSSGVAKAYDFDRVNSLLISKANSLEATERRVLDIVAKWNEIELSEKTKLVEYPDDFDVRSLYDEFDVAAKLILIEAPDEVRREQMRVVTKKLFPMAPKVVVGKFEIELKNWPPEVPDQTAPASGSQAKPQAENRQGEVTKNTSQSKSAA